MLSHPQTEVRRRAVAVVEQHGRPHIGRITSSDAFRAAASTEFHVLAPILEQRLRLETDIETLSTLHYSLAQRWAAQRPGWEACERLLTIPLEPLAKAFHYGMQGPWFFDFQEARAQAPVDDRWSWFVRAFLHGRSNAERDRVVNALQASHATPQDVATAISVISSSKRPQFLLDEWCRRDPEIFAAATELLAAPASSLAQSALRRHRYRQNSRAVLDDLLELPPSRSTEDVERVLGDAVVADESIAIETARFLSAQSDFTLRRRALDFIPQRDNNASEALDILERCLRDGDWSKHWDAVFYTLDKPERRTLLLAKPTLRYAVEGRLVDGSSIGHDWHEIRLVEMLCGDDKERVLDLAARFLTHDTYASVHKIGVLVAGMATSSDNIELLARTFVDWARSLGRNGASRIESILEDALGELQPPPNTLGVARALLGETDPAARDVGLVLLSEMQTSPEACAAIADLASDDTDWLQEKAASALHRFRWPRGGWSRSIGGTSPELLALQATLDNASTLATQRGRVLIGEVKRMIVDRIESDARQDDEALDPR